MLNGVKLFAVCVLMVNYLGVAFAQPEIEYLPGSEKISDARIQELISIESTSNFAPPFDATAISPEQFALAVNAAKRIHSNLPVEYGSSAITYDVVIQAGHYFRKKGATGSELKRDGRSYLWEQHVVAVVANAMVSQLKYQGINVLFIGAGANSKDDVLERVDGKDIGEYLKDDPSTPDYDGISTRAFISLHMDGATKPCSLGPSIGYPTEKDGRPLQILATALAISLGKSPAKFLRDTRTSNLARYYAFRDIRVSDFKGVVELGEISCEQDAKDVLQNAELLGINLATATEIALREINTRP